MWLERHGFGSVSLAWKLCLVLLQPATHAPERIPYDARDSFARVEEPPGWRGSAVLVPRTVGIACERRTSFEAHRLSAAVIDELDDVRSKPLLFSCLIEED
jgi:hypothetical protein